MNGSVGSFSADAERGKVLPSHLSSALGDKDAFGSCLVPHFRIFVPLVGVFARAQCWRAVHVSDPGSREALRQCKYLMSAALA